MRTGSWSKPATALAAIVLLGAGPAVAQTSAYKTPAAGKWKIQDISEQTAGGSATLAKGGKRITKLSLNVGPRNANQAARCGDIKKLELAKSVPIKRLGTAKRPAVGRFSSKTQLIESTKTKVKVDGTATDGTIKVIFEKSGRQAFTAELISGSCKLNFAIRK